MIDECFCIYESCQFAPSTRGFAKWKTLEEQIPRETKRRAVLQVILIVGELSKFLIMSGLSDKLCDMLGVQV